MQRPWDATSRGPAGLLEGNDHHRPCRGACRAPPRRPLRRARGGPRAAGRAPHRPAASSATPRPPPTSPRTSPSPPSAAPGRCAIPRPSTHGCTASPCAPRCARRAARGAAERPSAPATTRRGAASDPQPSPGASRSSTACRARQRAALTLRYVHDLTDAEIARALRCRPGTVRSLLSRGRDAVRAAIDDRPEPRCEPLRPTCTTPSRRCTTSSRPPTRSRACSPQPTSCARRGRWPARAGGRRASSRSIAASAALVGALAALPGGDSDPSRPRDAHGIFQAAAAVAAEQPAPLAYRYTRALDRFVDEVQAGSERARVTYEQTSENWTSNAFRGRTLAARGTATWATPPSAALRKAGGQCRCGRQAVPRRLPLRRRPPRARALRRDPR